jgi:hypothetical protein
MKIRIVLCIMTLTMLNFFDVPSLFATPLIDGKFEASEGYTTGYNVDLNVESGKGKNKTTVNGGEGELWITQDSGSGDLFLAFIQPLSLVDNSYGDNSIGWGKNIAPSGKNHNYKDLTGSDKAQFVFTDGLDNTVLDIVLDYAHASSGSIVASVTEGDGEVNTGNASDVKEAATSLVYNYNIYGLSNPELFGNDSSSPEANEDYEVEDALLADWVFASVYELRVDGSVFDENGFGEVELVVVHDSPNKIAKNKVYPKIGDQFSSSNPVPEPTTIALLGIGLAGLAGGAVRRRLKKAKQ